MRLQQLGWDSFFQKQTMPEGCIPARVSEQHKSLYHVISEKGDFLCEISGKLRFQTEDRTEYPGVGDWTGIELTGQERAIIRFLFSRKTSISRKAAGKIAEQQILCANVDWIFVVTSMNQEFNLRRLERYLSVAWESGAQPVLILNKADLCHDPTSFKTEAELAANGVNIHLASAMTGLGMEIFEQYLAHGKTGVMIGSSGVGKSTLINTLIGRNLQKVGSIRLDDDHGRHTTTFRELIPIATGGIVFDTPGMRELGLWDSTQGLSKTFEDLEILAENCKYRNCTHRTEPACAVQEAAKNGLLSHDRIESYRKLQAELTYLESKTDVTRKLHRKSFMKKACKAQKQIYKNKGW